MKDEPELTAEGHAALYSTGTQFVQPNSSFHVGLTGLAGVIALGGTASSTPPVAMPVVHHGAAGITLHEPPPPLPEALRSDRTWSFMVRTIDDLRDSVCEAEEMVAQHALGPYVPEDDMFRDMKPVFYRMHMSVLRLTEQAAKLPPQRKAILSPHITWATAVINRINDDILPLLGEARQAAWQAQRDEERRQRGYQAGMDMLNGVSDTTNGGFWRMVFGR